VRVKIIAEVNADEKRLIKRYCRDFDPECEGHPQPFAEFVDDTFYYRTASGKGEYYIDFDEKGRIVITFEGYRNSFRGGNQLMELNWFGSLSTGSFVEVTFINQRDGARRITIGGTVVEFDTSAPDKPFFK